MSMAVVIFGATGTAGGYVVRACLEAGMTVTAFTRQPSMGLKHPRLRVLQGSLSSVGDVGSGLVGQDAVVSTLGARNYDAPDPVVSSWLALTVPLAREIGLTRVVVVGGAGILQADESTLVHELSSYPPIFRHVNEDMTKVYNLLGGSDLEWTMVCCPRILDNTATTRFLATDDYMPPGGQPTIEAGNIGEFIAHELVENEHIRHRVGLCSA